MLPASKSLNRNEKLFLCCFLCEVPARGTAAGKLIVFHAVSETSASCCEEPLTSGGKLKFTKLSEPRGQYLRIGLQAYSGGSNSLSQAEITLIATTFSPKFSPFPFFFPPLLLLTFTNHCVPQVDKTDASFSFLPSAPTKLHRHSHKNLILLSKEIKTRIQMVIRIQTVCW